jgi:chromate transporter
MSGRGATLSELARAFLRIGALGFGGPAIIGLMQLEIQERRGWIDKPRFLEGLALVNVLPGPVAAQLAIFIGYLRGGIAGGIVAGLAFILPGFLVITALAAAYGAYGALEPLRNALWGVAPVVLGIFAAAVYRLGKSAIKERVQLLIAIASGLAVACDALAVAWLLLVAGCAGVARFHSAKRGLLALATVCALYAALWQFGGFAQPGLRATQAPSLLQVGTFFLEVGALTFGGGLSILAFVQQAVVREMGWLSAQEFLDGLAIGQLTPGPVLMLAAFVGYKLFALPGALLAAAAVFLPSFVVMLALLPALRHLGSFDWLKAALRAIVPAVIGALAASLAQLAWNTVDDLPRLALLAGACAAILLRNVDAFPLMAIGALVGIVEPFLIG